MITIYAPDLACYTFAKEISIFLNPSVRSIRFMAHYTFLGICLSPKPIFCPNLEVSVNIGLGEG